MFWRAPNDDVKERLRKMTEEKRLLPTGVSEFNQWAENIISQAHLTATPDSQKYALCGLLTELPASCASECDAYFISRLRKHAVNQVAVHLREKFYKEAKERLEKEEQNQAKDTPPTTTDGQVLEKQ